MIAAGVDKRSKSTDETREHEKASASNGEEALIGPCRGTTDPDLHEFDSLWHAGSAGSPAHRTYAGREGMLRFRGVSGVLAACSSDDPCHGPISGSTSCTSSPVVASTDLSRSLAAAMLLGVTFRMRRRATKSPSFVNATRDSAASEPSSIVFCSSYPGCPGEQGPPPAPPGAYVRSRRRR